MHIDDLPEVAAQEYEPPALTKKYLNAEHAADQWRGLYEHIAGVPGFDYSRPVVDACTPSDEGLIRVIDEKRRLDAAFLAVGRYHNPGRDKWAMWVRVRLHGRTLRSFDVTKKRVQQVRDEVDACIDREMDRRGMLLGSEARRRALDLGWKSPNRR